LGPQKPNWYTRVKERDGTRKTPSVTKGKEGGKKNKLLNHSQVAINERRAGEDKLNKGEYRNPEISTRKRIQREEGGSGVLPAWNKKRSKPIKEMWGDKGEGEDQSIRCA